MSDAARRAAEEALAAWDRTLGSGPEMYAAGRNCASALRALLAEQPATPAQELHFVCTDFPGPGDECVFVECEDGTGKSINAGEWVRRPDGLVALVVTALPAVSMCHTCKRPRSGHRHLAPCSCEFCCNRPIRLDGDGRDGDNGSGPFEE